MKVNNPMKGKKIPIETIEKIKLTKKRKMLIKLLATRMEDIISWSKTMFSGIVGSEKTTEQN